MNSKHKYNQGKSCYTQGLTTYSQSASLLEKLIGFEKGFIQNNENLLFGMLLFESIIDTKFKYL